MKTPTAKTIERLPWAARSILGCVAAALSVGLTYVVEPLRSYPLFPALPTIILAGWFLDVEGACGCAIVEIVLIEICLTESEFRPSNLPVARGARSLLFLLVATLLAILIRFWTRQRERLSNRELKRILILEQTQRQMAEERMRTSEALEEREAALRIALRASSMGLWIWDVDQDTTHWTDEIYRLLGREVGAFPPSNEAWFSAIHPEDAAMVREGVAQAARDGKDYHRTYRIVRPDGGVRWIESQGQCQRDKDGRITWIMGVLMDTTHRRQAEEAMLRAEKLAVAGRLAASMAHEINNPLEAIANLLYLITISRSAEEAQVHARSALDELLRVSMITQSTLKFHRQPGSPKVLLLSEVLESVIAIFRTRLNATEITIEMHIDNEIPVACMPTEAQQIFANLMANSIEAMARNGQLLIRLRHSRDWRNPDTDGMRVTFCDSGTGMDRQTMRRIFEPFFTTKPEVGTGLGLWVVAQLVERHRGHIAVWSRRRAGGSGTAFSIFLPTGRLREGESLKVAGSAAAGGSPVPVEAGEDGPEVPQPASQ